jgi:hypothetical protein
MIQQRHAGCATLTADRVLATRRLGDCVEAVQELSCGVDAALAAEPDPAIAERRVVAAVDQVIAIDQRLIEQGHVNELTNELVAMAMLQPMPALTVEPRQRLKELRQRLRGLAAVLALVPAGSVVALHQLRAEMRHTFVAIEFAIRQRDRLFGRRRNR